MKSTELEYLVSYWLLGSCFPHFATYEFFTIYAENLNTKSQFLKSPLQEYSHVLQSSNQELCRERKTPKTCEFLFQFGIPEICDLYMEKKANRGPGFQSVCLEFATHEWSKEFLWLDLRIILSMLKQHNFQGAYSNPCGRSL